MNELFTYLLKVSLAISLLTIPYYLFLRNDAMLVVKRAYLFGGLVLSWAFPLIAMSKPEIRTVFEPGILLDPDTPAFSSDNITLATEHHRQISGTVILSLLYITGILLLFAKNISSYIKTKAERSNQHSGNKNVIFTNGEQVFTIFPKVFLPKKYQNETDIRYIMIHEEAHIRQMHFIDLLLSELTLLLTWFNPFSWLISRMIKENHEHLADRAVLQQGVNPAHYKALLLNHAMGGEVFRLGHQFNHSLTKKRFKMMKNLKAPKKGFVKYLFIIPIILSFTLIVTAASQNKKTINGTAYLEKEGLVATGASVIVEGTTDGTVVDKNGKFSLEVEGNPTIIFSFVGYKTKYIQANEIGRKPVILEATTIKVLLDDKGSTNKVKNKSKEKKEIKNTDPDKPIFFVVEDMPSFKGGNEAFREYLAKKTTLFLDKSGKDLSGEVLVKFKVTTRGEIENVEVEKSSNDKLSKAAVKIIEDMPVWNPGKQRGKAVSTKLIVPVRFNKTQE